MDEWKDEFFNSAIRAIVEAPPGPLTPMQAAVTKSYSCREVEKMFQRGQKINAVDNGAKKTNTDKEITT